MFACSPQKDDETQKGDVTLLPKENFTANVDGKEISLYTLEAGDVTMQVTNFGGRVVSIWAPDREGRLADVVLGYEHIDRYLNNEGERFLGAVVGRYANRIARGRFSIDGVDYQVAPWSNGQCLHGGENSFDMKVWDVVEATPTKLVLSYVSPDMEDGFPGELTTVMTYSLSDDNAFKIEYEATTDKPTVVNFTNHSFFNLKGEGAGSIEDHVMTIRASHVTTVDSVLIPTGEIASVEGTPLDFRTPVVIGDRIESDFMQMVYGSGYDHNYILDKSADGAVELAATVYEPMSGRLMEVWTDQPAMQFYSGNHFPGTVCGKGASKHIRRESLALETQKYPDSPNQPSFPTTTLRPGETYRQTCIYKFGVK